MEFENGTEAEVIIERLDRIIALLEALLEQELRKDFTVKQDNWAMPR